MRLSFKKALSANIWSSIAGIGTQAATAPLFLLFLHVDQFAQWILISSVSSYVSLALNGLFYTLMNELTILSYTNEKDKAADIYNCGIAFIGAIWIAAASGLAIAFGLFGTDLSDSPGLLLIGILLNVTNLASILFDANFRTMGRYLFGTNILTGIRTLDWCTSVALIIVTRNVPESFVLLLIYKIVVTLLVFLAFQLHGPALKVRLLRSNYTDCFRIIAAAKGQLTLSAWTATAIMGPQIVVSAISGAMVSVAFNTYRTYFRIIAAFVTILTSAAWPLLSEMYAERRFSEIRVFMSRLLVHSLVGASVLGLILLLAAGPVFEILFRSKVPVDHAYMALILISVLLNCGITIQQSLYLATNLSSRILLGSFILTVLGLVLMTMFGAWFGFALALFTLVTIDCSVFIIMLYGARSTLTELKLRGGTSSQ